MEPTTIYMHLYKAVGYTAPVIFFFAMALLEGSKKKYRWILFTLMLVSMVAGTYSVVAIAYLSKL